jgi:hypothetical protein
MTGVTYSLWDPGGYTLHIRNCQDVIKTMVIITRDDSNV